MCRYTVILHIFNIIQMTTTSDLEENAENAKYKYITKQIIVKTIS